MARITYAEAIRETIKLSVFQGCTTKYGPHGGVYAVAEGVIHKAFWPTQEGYVEVPALCGRQEYPDTSSTPPGNLPTDVDIQIVENLMSLGEAV